MAKSEGYGVSITVTGRRGAARQWHVDCSVWVAGEPDVAAGYEADIGRMLRQEINEPHGDVAGVSLRTAIRHCAEYLRSHGFARAQIEEVQP